MLPHIAAYLKAKDTPATFDLAVHSPGRINVIGEHTDYTGGLVMPAAIDKGIEFYVRRTDGRSLRLHAVDLGATHELPLPVTGRTGELWVDYLAGIANEFQKLGYEVPGLEIFFGGDVPRGSGMSSSAALEGGMAFVLNELTGAGLSRPELAALCKRSSNGFMDVPSGIMDQFASLNGRASGPIVLDCNTLEFEPVTAELPGYVWILANSMVTHDLSDGAYRIRVQECATALAAIQEKFPEVPHLSAATGEQLEAVADGLDPTVLKRARYVISENDRVRRMQRALSMPHGAADAVGFLLNETHRGLRDDYEVSCEEVDFLQMKALKLRKDRADLPGGRIMGGGFGGCTLNLVKKEFAPTFQTELTAAYQEAYGKTPEFYVVNIGPGTSIISA